MSQPYTIEQFAEEVKVEIYKIIQSEYAGEMEEDDFDDYAEDCQHEKLDDAIDLLCGDEVDRLLCDYGIAKAVVLYTTLFGLDASNPPTDKMYLYFIIRDRLHDIVSYDDYQTWCENHSNSE